MPGYSGSGCDDAVGDEVVIEDAPSLGLSSTFSSNVSAGEVSGDEELIEPVTASRTFGAIGVMMLTWFELRDS